MTAKQEAKRLVEKFIPHTKVFHEVLGWEDYIDSAKQCANICVEEMIVLNGNLYLNGIDADYYKKVNAELFEIKAEIQKL